MKALLAARAEVNAVDKFGYTPLLYAATIDFGSSETLETLLAGGADPKVKDAHGRTPLGQAREFPYLRAVLEKAVAARR